MHRERDGDVGAGLEREVEIGAARQRGRARIDDDELRAALLRFADVRNDVNAGRGRVDAPEDDQLRFRIVLVGDRRHLAVQRHVGRAGRRRADRAGEARRAEAPPQLRVDVVLREQAVRPAVGVRQDRLGAGVGLRLLESRGDELDRFVPGHALELARPLAPAADGRIEQAIRAVDALAELAHLGADVAVGDRVLARAVDLHDLALLHGDRQAARVGAVERAGGLDDGRRAAERLFARRSIGFAWCRHTDTISPDELRTHELNLNREP